MRTRQGMIDQGVRVGLKGIESGMPGRITMLYVSSIAV